MDCYYATSSQLVRHQSSATALAITLTLKCKHIDSHHGIVALFVPSLVRYVLQRSCLYVLFVSIVWIRCQDKFCSFVETSGNLFIFYYSENCLPLRIVWWTDDVALQPQGFMESDISYSSIQDINIISRWDAGHKFCLRLTVADGSVLLQVRMACR